jgi:hypothetical protein
MLGSPILRKQVKEHGFLVVLLEFDHVVVRVVNEKLQDPVSSAAPNFDSMPVFARSLHHLIYILNLEAEVTEQPPLRPLGLLQEKLEKSAISTVEEYAIKRAGRVPELMRDVASQQPTVEKHGSLNVGRSQAGVRKPL